MSENISIDITPNVLKCLEIVKEAVDALPLGDLKTRGIAAHDYLKDTFEGKPQPADGDTCPIDKIVVHGG